MKSYPRFVSSELTPFDPIELIRETEKIVCRGKERKYTKFYCVGVYGGISTGYAVGCSLRCVYCWSDESRDFPEKFGTFFSPEEAFIELYENAKARNIKKLRLSGAEPTLGKNHVLSLLEFVESSDMKLFILETNGTLLGIDKDYVNQLSKFSKIHVRVSLKAGTQKFFTKITGARSGVELPFQSIRNLSDAGVSCHTAAMTDPRIMPKEEKEFLIKNLREIDNRIVKNLEEEIIDPYPSTLKRLRLAGIKL